MLSCFLTNFTPDPRNLLWTYLWPILFVLKFQAFQDVSRITIHVANMQKLHLLIPQNSTHVSLTSMLGWIIHMHDSPHKPILNHFLHVANMQYLQLFSVRVETISFMHVSFCPRWYWLGGEIWQSSKFAETSWIAWPRRTPSLKQTTSVMRCECRKNQNYCLLCVCSLPRSFCPPEGRLQRRGLCALCQCLALNSNSRVLQDRNFDLFFGLSCFWWQPFAEGLLDGTCPHGICRTSYIMDQHAHAASRDGMCWSQICWGERRRQTAKGRARKAFKQAGSAADQAQAHNRHYEAIMSDAALWTDATKVFTR